jgi:excisionase family DNA binding protein
MTHSDADNRPVVANASALGSRELSSWKEIASYLGVNVRTAQKWERDRGLPVRRMGGARSRVNADTASLDAWKQQLIYATNRQDRCYRWPLGHGITVEVRFLGADLEPAHIELLCAYLNLLKTALP